MKVAIIGGAATGMGVSARLLRSSNDVKITVYQSHDYISLGACGLPYFVGDNFQDEKEMIARTPDFFKEKGVDVKTNAKVSDIDFNNKQIKYLNNNKEFIDEYDRLVISVGAKPIILDIFKGLKVENLFTLTSLEDGKNLKSYIQGKEVKNILIIGAGFIGLELAENLKELNKNVVILEKQDKIMKKAFDEEYSSLIFDELIKNNVDVKLNNSVTNIITKGNKIIGVELEDKSKLLVDCVVMCVGFAPNTEFLKNTKLKMNQNGAIIVDKYCQTSVKDVYSGGDCATSKNVITGETEYVPLATLATKAAKVIADNILDLKKEFYGSLKTSIFRVFKKGFARTGLTYHEAKDANFDVNRISIKDKNHTNYVSGQEDLSLTLVYDNKNNVILGAEMCGTGESIMRIHSLVTLIWNKIKINDYVAQLDLPYSPPFARTNDIVLIALSKLIK